MATAVIIIVVLAVLVLAVILGINLWGIGTQRGDRRHMFGGRRRRQRSAP
jgi:uncharacterized membrane protein affecting hemolysin expression